MAVDEEIRIGRDVLAQRCAAQQLSGSPARSAVEVTGRLLAVQGQDPRGARLAIRARSVGLTASDVDRALTEDRSLVISWLNRGTLHLVRAEDYWWLHRLTTPPSGPDNARRLAEEGVKSAEEADRAASIIDSVLAANGAMTRRQLGDLIAAAGIATKGQALVHLLYWAALRGLIVRGPMVGSEHAFVRVGDWLPPPGKFDRDVALAELARRYLAGHGPASERDLAKWAGLPLRDVRRGLAGIAGELSEREDRLAELARQELGGHKELAGCHELPPPRLLGAFDPLLHGWVDRTPVLGSHTQIITSNGLFRPFALVDGRAVATWNLASGRVGLTALVPVAEPVAAALSADADDVIRFLGYKARPPV